MRHRPESRAVPGAAPSRGALASAVLAIVVLTLAGTAAGCRAASRRTLGPVEPAFAPAFQALGQAVEAGDDAAAEQVLGAILARGPEGDTLARAEGYGRILAGRRLARALELSLVAQPVGSDGERVRVRLEARHDLDHTVRVRSLPGMLELLFTGVDPEGYEQRSARSVGAPEVADFEVHPGRVTRIRLGDFPLQAGTALALRVSFELEFASSELSVDGRPFPANELRVRPCSMVRLAAYLPSGPVEPSELMRYLRGERFSTPAMLERAVRIVPERRTEALDLLAAAAPDMNHWELERALPALRWLSGNRHLGADVDSWRLWLRSRAEGGADADGAAGPGQPAGAAR